MDTKRFHRPEYKKQIHANRTHRRPTVSKKRDSGSSPRLDPKSSLKFLALLVILGVVIYLSYFAKFLQINGLVVSGASPAQVAEINGTFSDYLHSASGIIPQKNIIFFDSATFQEYLLSHDNGISAVKEVKKKLFNKILVNVTERVPAFVYQTQNGVFIINSDGVISGAASPDQQANLPKILLTATDAVSPGEEILSEQRYNFISGVVKGLTGKTGQQIDHFEMPAVNTDQVTLLTKANLKIYFDASGDSEQALNNFAGIWSSLSAQQQAKLNYIDLRFKQNAYLCYRGDKCAQ